MAARRRKRKTGTHRRRKGARRGKRKHGRKRRGGHIPLPVLEHRLKRLSKIVASRK